MWVGPVDIPDALIRAHRDDRLVIFVGAGASVDLPSGLPLFGQLAEMVAAESGRRLSRAERERPDWLLGRLDDGDADIHLRVSSILGDPMSRANRLHNAIVDLAAVPGVAPRIVTTNYDRHLSTVLTARSIDAAEYAAPALPVGHDFDGIVYLHGTLTQEPRRLVVTDRDLGRAYLTEAWAARFLEPMFRSYSALFVGYSHSDIVMQYLARGLGPGAERFAFASRTDTSDWTSYGVTPVWYDAPNDSHALLTVTVEKWAARAAMNLLDHQQRIAELVQSEPSGIPDEMSYLETLLEENATASLFTQLARGDGWLDWAATRPEFQRVFDPSSSADEVTRTLAWWYAEHYVVSEQHSEHAFQVLAGRGGTIGPAGVHAIGQRLHMLGGPRPAWLDRWIPHALQFGGEPHSWWELALLASDWVENRSTALLLFAYVTDPQIGSSAAATRRSRRDRVNLRCEAYNLSEAWNQVFLPHLDESTYELLPILEHSFRRAHQMHLSAQPESSAWDPWSLSREAIWVSEDRPHDPIHALIDIARDCLASAVSTQPAAGAAICEAWMDSDVPILQRLAIYAVATYDGMTGSDKVARLVSRPDLVFRYATHREVLKLVAEAVPDADVDRLDELVLSVQTASTGVAEEDAADRARFDVLSWIDRHRPGHPATANALRELIDVHPELADRGELSLEPSAVVGFGFGDPPMPVASFHDLIESDGSAATLTILAYEGSTFPGRGPTWDAAIGLVVDTVREHPGDGFVLLEQTPSDDRIVSAVVRGWAQASITQPEAHRVLDLLAQRDLRRFHQEISTLLADGGQSERSPTAWHRLGSARRLALDLFALLPEEDDSGTPQDWLSSAINRSSGRLAQFWLHAVSADWRDAADNWSWPAPDALEAFEQMLTRDDSHGRYAEVVLASQLHFLHAAASAWTERWLLPRFAWKDPERAARTWQGFLFWGQPRDRLMQVGLLDGYLETAEHLPSFGDEPRRQFASHLAAATVFSTIDPANWLAEFTRRADVEDRVHWIDQVSYLLDDLSADAADGQWTRWMHNYWRQRVSGSPTPLTGGESSALVAWTLRLSSAFNAAVDLVLACEVSVPENSGLLHRLAAVDTPPFATGKLLAHILRGTQPPFWDCSDVHAIVERIGSEIDPATMSAIRNEGLRLLCPNADKWQSPDR